MANGRGRTARQRDYGADDAFPIGDIDDILPGLIENCGRVYYTMGLNADFDHRVIGWVNSLRGQSRLGIHTPQEFVALDHLLHDMRLYKGRSELSVMRRAAQIAVGAHLRAMRVARPGVYEYQVMAEILHEFHRHNADISYHPIVGGGANACTLHYHANNALLEDGDLLLIDAGCEYQYYASDITRTFPVNGRFTAEQRAIYEVVLDAQDAAIARCRPGCHWNEPHDAAVQSITRGLVRLGLLKGRVPTLIKEGAYRSFFMHRTGHWLGMDVHDVGDYKVGDEWRVLEPGMCLTVEPGIYIPAGSKGVPRRWWNIGVRIEDDVAITTGRLRGADRRVAAHPRRSRAGHARGMSEPAPCATTCDVAICGGGMVGATLALALAPLPLSIVLIEAVSPGAPEAPSFDERTTALANGSVRTYRALGVWRDMEREATAIHRIHVSEQGRFGVARIDAAEQGIEALGYVISNRAIGAALWPVLAARERVRVIAPARVVDTSNEGATASTSARGGDRPDDDRCEARDRGGRRAIGAARAGGNRGRALGLCADRNRGDADHATLPRSRRLRALHATRAARDPATR